MSNNVIKGLFSEAQLLEAIEDVINKQGKGNSSGGDDGMEARVAKLEAAVEHIQADVSDLKADLRDFKAQVHDDFQALRSETRADFAALRTDARSDFRWLLTIFGGAALGLAAMMAKGFGWLKF